jgi:hypothetical protein
MNRPGAYHTRDGSRYNSPSSKPAPRVGAAVIEGSRAGCLRPFVIRITCKGK